MVTCPSGTKRAGDGVDSLAQCNIEQDNSLMPTIQNGINFTIGIIGVIAVVMIIIGGINYTTSQGDAGKTKKAKDTILYGIIGLIVAILAFAIVTFITKEIPTS